MHGEKRYQPELYLDDMASPEQRNAIDIFMKIASEFTLGQILAATTVVDRGYDRDIVSTLACDFRRDKIDALYNSWVEIKANNVAEIVKDCDDETEGIISANPRFRSLVAQLSTPQVRTLGKKSDELHNLSPEEAVYEIFRLRLAIFAGRLAASHLSDSEKSFEHPHAHTAAS